jgi:hypothetical protein
MPAHNYAPVEAPPSPLSQYTQSDLLKQLQIPLEDEIISPSYNTGIPSTAPPSFHSIPLSTNCSSLLPHRNDESAATIMPQEERQLRVSQMAQSLAGDGSAISLWAPSESNLEFDRDLEAAKEDAIALLMERVEQLERRVEENGRGEEGLNKSIEKVRGRGEEWSRMDYCGLVGLVLFVVWICATVTLAVAARYRAAGNKE